jgi:hypothetical protein
MYKKEIEIINAVILNIMHTGSYVFYFSIYGNHKEEVTG